MKLFTKFSADLVRGVEHLQTFGVLTPVTLEVWVTAAPTAVHVHCHLSDRAKIIGGLSQKKKYFSPINIVWKRDVF